MSEPSVSSGGLARPKPRLLEELREVMRREYYSIYKERSDRD
jgi:hypothetical protein